VKKAAFYYLFAISICLLFIGLGRWQLGRAEWKTQRLADAARVLTEKTPHALNASSKEDKTQLRWVAGSGHFLELPALLLDNQRRGGQVGIHVYRVFQPDQGKALLVDLGWLALPADRKMPALKNLSGQYQLDGLLTTPPSPGIALGPSHVKTNKEYWLLTRMLLPQLSVDLNTPLATRVLRLNPDLPIGYARDLNLLPNTLPPEKHKGYALQWFGLAAATIIITLVLTLRRKKS
jgi:surfeit locus 1 family protein